jgi:hypothetical protein
MTELYRNELGTVQIKLPLAPGQPATVSVQAVKDGVTTTIGSGVSYNTSTSTVSVQLPFSYTSIDQEFELVANFTMGFEQYSITEPVQVVTPLLSRARAELIAPGEYEDKEPIVRHIIESVTGGNKFGKWIAEYAVYGEGEKNLALPHRLLSVTGISYGDVIEQLDSFIIKGDGRMLTKIRGSLYNQLITTNPIRNPYRDRRFNDNIEYVIAGTWGYNSVPVPVTKAAEILFEDITCPEAAYRNKYVKQVKAADWTIQFSNRAWEDTGNVVADQLLQPYMNSRMMIV